MVSKKWSVAAAAATVHVELQETDRSYLAHKEAASAFQRWFNAHASGTQLQTLKLAPRSFGKQCMLQLPSNGLQQLQRLELPGFWLQLPQARTASSMQDEHIPLFPNLVELNLRGADVPSPGLMSPAPAAVLQLARTPQLTHLNLEDITLKGLDRILGIKDETVLQQLHAGMSDLLQQLPQLSVLKLSGVDVGAAAAQHLSATTRLQELRISLCAGMPCWQPAAWTACQAA
jgi:hypothetical protein